MSAFVHVRGTRGKGRHSSVRAARKVALTTLVALAATGLSSCGDDDDDENAAADPTVRVCTPDPAGGRPYAEGRITNHSSKDSAYTFRVSFIDAVGNKVSDGAVAVASVEAGGTATWRTQGAADAKGPLVCQLENVTRTAVP